MQTRGGSRSAEAGGIRVARGVQSEPNATMFRRARTKAGPDTSSGMTRLSGFETAWRSVRCLPVLARRSLLPVAVAALSTSCVDPPPTYTAPEQTPPIVLGNKVVPPTISVFRVTVSPNTALTVPLHVPFRSMDGPDNPVTAVVWRDLEEGLSQKEKNDRFIRAVSQKEDLRPLDEQEDRTAEFAWEPQAGCRTVTMEISHEKNYPTDRENGIFEPGHLPPIDQNDIAQVTWFFDVQDSTVDPSERPICWGSQ